MKTSGSPSPIGGPVIPDLHALPSKGIAFLHGTTEPILQVPVRPTIVAAGKLTEKERLQSESLVRSAEMLHGRARNGSDAALMLAGSQTIFDALRGGSRLSADAAARLRDALEGVLQVMYTSPSYVQAEVVPDEQSQVEGNARLALERLDLAKLG